MPWLKKQSTQSSDLRSLSFIFSPLSSPFVYQMDKTVQKRSIQEKKCLLCVNMLFPPSNIFVKKRRNKREMLERRCEQAGTSA